MNTYAVLFSIMTGLCVQVSYGQTNTFPASGNVGIGTSSPAHKLSIQADYPGFVYLNGNTAGHAPYVGAAFVAHTNIDYRGRGLFLPTTAAETNSAWFIGVPYGGGGFQVGSSSIHALETSGGPYEREAARLFIAPSANVGIGTYSPQARLHVAVSVTHAIPGSTANSYPIAQFKAQTAAGAARGLEIGAPTGAVTSPVYLKVHGTSNRFALLNESDVEQFTVLSSGRIGIGTSSPTTKLTIVAAGSGDGLTVREDGTSGVTSFYLTNGSGNSASRNWLLATNLEANGALSFRRGNAAGADPYSAGSTSMILTSAGDVGIGTSTPTHKLSVNGTIRSKEVIVETTGWSDYVFADDYALKPLAEVEAHIKEHKHLPGIPSAKEVAEQGVSLGEMQAKLLAKIEELTLHQIAQGKRAQAQENEIASLRAKVAQLESHPINHPH